MKSDVTAWDADRRSARARVRASGALVTTSSKLSENSTLLTHATFRIVQSRSGNTPRIGVPARRFDRAADLVVHELPNPTTRATKGYTVRRHLSRQYQHPPCMLSGAKIRRNTFAGAIRGLQGTPAGAITFPSGRLGLRRGPPANRVGGIILSTPSAVRLSH